MFSASLPGGFEIRPIDAADATSLFQSVDRNRAHLREWLFWVDATVTVEDTRAFVDAAIENHAISNALTSAIWDGREVAGVIGTHKIDWVNRRCEIGYWLGEAYLGRGIMSAAVGAMLAHLFEVCELHRVECQCAVGNARSCAIPERMGFAREGIAREALLLQGEYHDLVMWSLLRKDWKK